MHSQGSGKGTLSGRLHEAYPSLTTVSAGDLLREHIRLGDELGKEADAVIKTGGLMPDEAVMKMIGNKVAELDGKVSAKWGSARGRRRGSLTCREFLRTGLAA